MLWQYIVKLKRERELYGRRARERVSRGGGETHTHTHTHTESRSAREILNVSDTAEVERIESWSRRSLVFVRMMGVFYTPVRPVSLQSFMLLHFLNKSTCVCVCVCVWCVKQV